MESQLSNEIRVIDSNYIIVNGQLYKRLKTSFGKYSKERRRQYMRTYRKKLIICP